MRLFGPRKRTIRATGAPYRVMTTSFPDSAKVSKKEKIFFASLTETVTNLNTPKLYFLKCMAIA